MSVSVVIVSWNAGEALRGCLTSVLASALDAPPEVVVVDNASTDGTIEMVTGEFVTVRLLRSCANEGFARACNRGIGVSSGRYVLLLNSDTVVAPRTLGELIAFMDSHPDAGICGPRLVRPDGAGQPFAFGDDPTLGYLVRRRLRALRRRHLHDWEATGVRAVHWVSGACLLARREALVDVGPLDEQMFLYFEDNDLCLRMRQRRWGVYHNPAVAVVHHGGWSARRNPEAAGHYDRSLLRFYAKHYGRLETTVLRLLLAPYRWLTSQDQHRPR